ncbi:MAG TPA: D-alanyl-D-alanine carboxypeptidase family protein [Candidatus Faecousia intestinigallinarum]|nr:D-alanyl-D-alanine carboxypeptidase family protein [Candidatus Faecousia intestinigallinarum]
MQIVFFQRNFRRLFLCCLTCLLVGSLAACAGAPEPTVSSSQQPAASTHSTQPPSTVPTEASTVSTTQPPAPDRSAWNLRLVNPWNYLPEDFEITLTYLSNGQAVDERCYPDLQDMMDACRAAGLSPIICSSFRTQDDQEYLYNNKINRLIAQGYSEEEAPSEAAKVVAVPGTSEHQLGLALDIVDESYQLLNEEQEDTAVQKWLMEHSWEYGFILRYPSDKSEITGIIYEPWHYRYVGKEAAKEMKASGQCLEEYLGDVPTK